MRFVVCGEALIDLMPDEMSSPAQSRWVARSGGSPLNTCTALAKLGCDAHFLGRLSADVFGSQLRSHLETAGVQLDLAVSTQDPTSIAVVSLDEDGKASYVFHFEGTSSFNWQPGEFPQLTSDDWVHFGSIGAVIGEGAKHMLDFLRHTEATLSYDINVRPSTMPDRRRYLEAVTDLMAAVGNNGGIVKASDEDIAWLMDDNDSPLGYAEAWAKEFNLGLFIVTLGAAGVAAVKPDGRIVQVPGHNVEVVDTVGAGDTFMAGFLSAYGENPQDLEAALSRGVAAAAIVVTRPGAQPPTAAEVNAWRS